MFDGKININSDTVEKAIDTLSDALKPITKSASEEFGLYLAENIKMWRVKRQIKNVKKVVENCKKAGFDPKQLNLKVLFPYLENVSLEEDEEMQDKWADLITNYVDPSVNLTLTVYPDILRQLSTPEVKALEFLYAFGGIHLSVEWEVTEVLSGTLLISKEISLNLMRLNLIEGKYTSRDTISEIEDIKVFTMTEFGEQFVKACTRP